VDVIEQRSVVGDDGLIGADVFSAFLVDIDFPNEKLHLTQLPKRPEEAASFQRPYRGSSQAWLNSVIASRLCDRLVRCGPWV
jgi:hypothetical protein